MAIKKIQMIPEGANDYADILHPETSSDLIIGQGMWGVTAGINSYVVTIPNITSLFAGVKATVKFSAANTAASTIKINGLGAKSITKAGGATLTAGNIKSNGVYTLVYDGTSFQLQGEGGEYGTALASDVLSPKTIGTDGGLVTGTIPSKGAQTYDPGITAQLIESGQYLSGRQTIAGVSVPVANVLVGTTIAGQAGTMVNNGAYNATINTQGGRIAIPKDYHNGSGGITASFANLVAGNVKKGINIGGVVGTYLTPTVAVTVPMTYIDANTQETAVLPSRPYVIMLLDVEIVDSGKYAKAGAEADLVSIWTGTSFPSRDIMGEGTWWGDGGNIDLRYNFSWVGGKIRITHNAHIDDFVDAQTVERGYFGTMKVIY